MNSQHVDVCLDPRTCSGGGCCTRQLLGGSRCQDANAVGAGRPSLENEQELARIQAMQPREAPSTPPPAVVEAVPRNPIHVCELIDWLAARYRAAGGKEGITDLSAWSEEVMRWTEERHGIAPKAAQEKT